MEISNIFTSSYVFSGQSRCFFSRVRNTVCISSLENRDKIRLSLLCVAREILFSAWKSALGVYAVSQRHSSQFVILCLTLFHSLFLSWLGSQYTDGSQSRLVPFHPLIPSRLPSRLPSVSV